MTKKAKTKTMALVQVGTKDTQTPDERVTVIRGYLDRMEIMELQKAAGSILTGLELLALHDQVGRSAFKDLFEAQIKRDSFSYRSAARYMADATRVRRELLKGGAVNLAGILSVAPSALRLGDQMKLQKLITSAVGSKSLTALRGEKQLTDGKAPATGKEAELEAHSRCWLDLCKRLTEAAVHRKTWKYLGDDSRRIVRDQVQLALDAIPE